VNKHVYNDVQLQYRNLNFDIMQILFT